MCLAVSLAMREVSRPEHLKEEDLARQLAAHFNTDKAT
jgi:hypothetical protein